MSATGKIMSLVFPSWTTSSFSVVTICKLVGSTCQGSGTQFNATGDSNSVQDMALLYMAGGDHERSQRTEGVERFAKVPLATTSVLLPASSSDVIRNGVP